jgi:hypothetical protein
LRQVVQDVRYVDRESRMKIRVLLSYRCLVEGYMSKYQGYQRYALTGKVRDIDGYTECRIMLTRLGEPVMK